MANETTEHSTQITTGLILVGTFFILLSICTAFGNVLIFLSIRRCKRFQTLTNRFVFSLAAADFLTGLFVLWESFFSWFPELEANRVACLSRFASTQPSFCSALHLIAIATDRYLAVLHPLRYHQFMTPRLVNVLIGAAWLLSTAIMAVVVGTAEFGNRDRLCMLPGIVPDAVLIAIFHVIVTLFVTVVFGLYGKIFWVARQQAKRIGQGEVNSGRDAKQKTFAGELKAAKQLSFIVLVFFFCHASFLGVLAMGYFYTMIMPAEKYILFYKGSLIIVFSNSGLNPIVYALKNRHFRESFKRIAGVKTIRDSDIWSQTNT